MVEREAAVREVLRSAEILVLVEVQPGVVRKHRYPPPNAREKHEILPVADLGRVHVRFQHIPKRPDAIAAEIEIDVLAKILADRHLDGVFLDQIRDVASRAREGEEPRALREIVFRTREEIL